MARAFQSKSLAGCIFLSSLVSCSNVDALLAPQTEVRYAFRIRVNSDPDVPLEGASVSVTGGTARTSDRSGIVEFVARGQMGDPLEIAVACPAGFTSPSKPLMVSIRPIDQASKLPTYEVACPPSTRRYVAAVRTEFTLSFQETHKDRPSTVAYEPEKGPHVHLPIVYLGRTIGETDDSGAGHIYLETQPGDQVEVTLLTENVPKEKGEIRPKNPVLTFVARSNDAYEILDQKFIIPSQRTTAVPRVRNTPSGPTRLK
jgi:hypothetical protein